MNQTKNVFERLIDIRKEVKGAKAKVNESVEDVLEDIEKKLGLNQPAKVVKPKPVKPAAVKPVTTPKTPTAGTTTA